MAEISKIQNLAGNFDANEQMFFDKKISEIQNRQLNGVLFTQYSNDCYAVLADTEFNTDSASDIIQISAVLLNKELKIISKFNRYVKLPENKNLDKFAIDITKITNEILQEQGVDFKEAMNDFAKFVNNSKIFFWGDDSRTIRKNLTHRLDGQYLSLLNKCFDFQSITMNYGVRQLSLKNFAERFGITFEGNAHDALFDSINLANIYVYFVKNFDYFLYLKENTWLNNQHGKGKLLQKVAKELLQMECLVEELITLKRVMGYSREQFEGFKTYPKYKKELIRSLKDNADNIVEKIAPAIKQEFHDIEKISDNKERVKKFQAYLKKYSSIFKNSLIRDSSKRELVMEYNDKASKNIAIYYIALKRSKDIA